MTVLVCIAGLPKEAADRVSGDPTRFTGEQGNKPIVFPIMGAPAYRHGMSDGYLSELRKRIEHLPALWDVGIVLAYANFPGQSTSDFLRAFFPFAVAVPFEPFYPNQAPKHERRRHLNRFLVDLEAQLKIAQNCSSQIKDKLSGQNFSPLTLPLANFRSNVLFVELNALFLNLWRQSDREGTIKSAIKAITAVHPLRRIKFEEKNHSSDTNKPYFLDGRPMRFKSPGNDRHGFVWEVSEGHRDRCLIASRVRIGGPIIARMHYDCDYHPKRPVTDDFINCHGESAKVKRTSHANIGSNDAVW